MTDSNATQKPAPTPNPIRLERILVPTDFSQPAARALDFALLLARELGATVKVFHVNRTTFPSRAGAAGDAALPGTPVPAASEVTQEIQARLEGLVQQCTHQAVSTHAEIVTAAGNPAEAIVSAAERERADVIVMGTHHRSGLRRAVLGSVAESVLRRAPMPVVVVPTTHHS